MNAVVNLSWSLALIALLGAALATIVGAASVRDRFFGVAVCCVVFALLLPLLGKLLGEGFAFIQPSVGVFTPPVSWVVTIPFTVGHMTLGVVLLRRYLRGPEEGRREAAELEQARGRERPRLLPNGEDAQ